MVFRSSIISAAIMCLAAGAFAQQQPVKIAVINIQSAIINTKDGQKANAKLESEYEPRKKDFDARNSEINQLQDQLSKGGSLMSEDKRNAMVRDIDEKKRRLERDLSDARDEMQKEQNELLGALAQRVMAVIEKYAKDNSYSLVLDDSTPSTPVLYTSTAIDITQDIVALYDKTTVNGAPAAPPAAVKPPTGSK
jgi:outer membrane protein